MKFLVIGCGSIGERHIRNLQSLSAGEILVYDIDIKRLAFIGEECQVRTYVNLDEALNHQVDALIICVPPALHISFALKAVEYGAHLFIEKPISHNLEGVDALIEGAKAQDLITLVGYNLRFHPGLRLVKQFLNEGRIGKVLSARVEAGQYLPDWHPWQDYREMYTAKKEMGGGIILDGSHGLDYVRWLLGEVREVSCFAGKLSSLEVETEDTAEILLMFDSGSIASVHLDFVQRAYSRSCKLIGEEGTIIWDYTEGRVRWYSAKTCKWQYFTDPEGWEPNQMYVDELAHFLHCLTGEEEPVLDVFEAKKVLSIALAAKTAAESKCIVRLRER